MPKTTYKQKIMLVSFGILLGIIFLEIGLRFGGFVYLYFQEKANLASMREKGNFVIMCLGESTTQSGGAASYPRQLEWILNQQDAGIAFTVLNKGISGTNTANIAAALAENIERYCPDMVITMMGINDGPNTAVYEDTVAVKSRLFLEQFRIYKLARLLKERIAHALNLRMANAPAVPENREQEGEASENSAAQVGDAAWTGAENDEEGYERYIRQARLAHRRKGDRDEAEKYYLKAIALQPENDRAYAVGGDGLISLYREQGKWDKAQELAERVVAVNPNNVLAYSELGRCYEHKGRIDDAVRMYHNSFELDPMHNTPFSKLTYYYNKLGQFEDAERICRRRLALRPDDEASNAALAYTYRQWGKEDLAEKYFGVAGELRAVFNPPTALNYRRIIDTLLDEGIQPVCMQYPVRNINDLSNMLRDREGVIFVDNENIFKQALSTGRYEDYFIDQFAGDFGHCTPRGNRLIAENIFAVLAATYFKGERFQRLSKVQAAHGKNLLKSKAVSVSVSSFNLDDQAASALIDNDPQTFWHVSLDHIGAPARVTVDFGEGNEKKVRSLMALPRQDIPRQFFRAAKLLGSADGRDWATISGITQESVPDGASWNKWTFQNDEVFRYYQLLLLDGHEDGVAHRFYSMAELAMFEF